MALGICAGNPPIFDSMHPADIERVQRWVVRLKAEEFQEADFLYLEKVIQDTLRISDEQLEALENPQSSDMRAG